MSEKKALLFNLKMQEDGLTSRFKTIKTHVDSLNLELSILRDTLTKEINKLEGGSDEQETTG